MKPYNHSQDGFICRMSRNLIVIGIIASWCASVIVAFVTDPTAFDVYANPASKPFICYIFHGIGILSLIAGGTVAMFNGGYRRVDVMSRMAFWTLQITSVVWALITYSIQDYVSWKALGATGPLVWLSCVLVFAGMDRNIWKLLEPVVRYLTYITALLAILSITTSYQYLSERWLSPPVQYMVILMWFAGWTFLTAWSCTSLSSYFRYFPYLVFILTTIFTQTRSWFLMSIFLLISFLYINNANKDVKTVNLQKYIVGISIVITLSTLVVFLFQEPLTDAFDRFNSRKMEDTRIGQYEEFFSQVPVSDLVLGRGPDATWKFGTGEGYEEYQNFDNAYIWMAFIGGLPTMISYFILIVLPGLKAFFRGAVGDDAAAAILVILWGLACTGFSTYLNPSLTPHSYLICLFSGRCLGYLAEQRVINSNNYESARFRQWKNNDVGLNTKISSEKL